MPKNTQVCRLPLSTDQCRSVLMDFFYRANAELLLQKEEDIARDVDEQTIASALCTQLAFVLKDTLFSKYQVDAEYNRTSNGRVKCAAIGGEPVRIRCDLLVHGEGKCDPDNLLCLEMKKAKRPEREKENDEKRLIALTTPAGDKSLYGFEGTNPAVVCGYLVGIYYIYDATKKTLKLMYYAEGELKGEEVHPFRYYENYKGISGND